MKATVIIPNYNGKQFLEPCLSSLEAQDYRDFGIVIVDNGSSDGSVEFLRDVYPDIPLIALPENYGFSRAVNEGIIASDSEYVILLNNDTTSDPSFVGELVKAMDAHPEAFSCASKMVQMYNPELLDSAGDLYTLLGWAVNRGTGRSRDLFRRPDEVFSACGGAAIYRRKIFDQIGLFDESHFAYLEDIDVGYRAKLFGYSNRYCPTAVVFHVGSGTSGSKYNDFKVELSARNNVWLNYKNMPWPQLLINSPFLLLGAAVKQAFFCKKGFGKAYFRGFMKGLAGIPKCRKAPMSKDSWRTYLQIEWDLFAGTVVYVVDWIRRKLIDSRQAS